METEEEVAALIREEAAKSNSRMLRDQEKIGGGSCTGDLAALEPPPDDVDYDVPWDCLVDGMLDISISVEDLLSSLENPPDDGRSNNLPNTMVQCDERLDEAANRLMFVEPPPPPPPPPPPLEYYNYNAQSDKMSGNPPDNGRWYSNTIANKMFQYSLPYGYGERLDQAANRLMSVEPPPPPPPPEYYYGYNRYDYGGRFYSEPTEQALLPIESSSTPMYGEQTGAVEDVMFENRRDEQPTRTARKTRQTWSTYEHREFLVGVEICGKGQWKSLSSCFVPWRSPAQVASHAQKFYNRQSAVGKRRRSIHDLTTADQEYVRRRLRGMSPQLASRNSEGTFI